jgi:hypothetical protein
MISIRFFAARAGAAEPSSPATGRALVWVEAAELTAGS